MPTELKVPNVGESITEVQIADWLKSDGDAVKKDENIVVIDSEKTSLDLAAPESGTLHITHQKGDTVAVGGVIATIEPSGEADKSAAKEKSPPKAEAKPQAKQKASEKEPQDTQKTESKEKPAAAKAEKPAAKEESATEEKAEKETEKLDAKAKPVASKKTDAKEPAEEEEPESKEASDKMTATEEETEASESPADTQQKPSSRKAPPPPSAPKAKPASNGETEVVPMTMLRRTVAKRLVDAKQQMAMLTTFNEVDMSAVLSLREMHKEAFEKRYQVKLGFMSFFVKAAIDALKQFPALNAEIQDNDIIYHNYFDIGVAIASDRGLVVPALRHAERMSFAELEKTIGDFASRAKSGKLKPEDLEGGTFTITNGGIFGSLLSTPIINPPQTGILGMHTIQERPVAIQGQIAIRPMMYLALTYDHRLVDGREAVLFLHRIKETIENPARMLIEI